MTVCFQYAPSRSAITRPTMSVELPAAQPTSTRTGLDGYCCACASGSASIRAARASRADFTASPLSMRKHFLPGRRHLGAEDLAVERIGDVERPALRAAEGDVGHKAVMPARVNEVCRQAVRVEAPDADAEVAHGEAVLLVHLDAVRARVAARELDRDPGLRERAPRHKRQAPDLLRTRDRDVHLRVRGVERDAVGGGGVVDDALQLAVDAQPIHAPARIGDPGLSLVGEVEVAVVGEMQVVQALESFAERGGEVGLDFPGLRVEQHQAALVVGDEHPAALVDLEPVRPAVVLHDQIPLSLRVDAEDAPERNVHAPQVPLAVERGAFEETVHGRALPVGIGPGGAALLAEFRGERGEGARFDVFDVLEWVEHRGSARRGRRITQGPAPRRSRYFFIRSLTGSLTFSILSISTLSSRPPTFSTRRM